MNNDSFFEIYHTLLNNAALLFFLLFVFLVYRYQIKKLKAQLIEKENTISTLYKEQEATKEDLQNHFDELVASQENLLESEQRYKLVIDATHDGIWDWNLKTNELTFSEKGYEMLGYKEKDFNKKMDFFETLIHPDDMEKLSTARLNHFKNESDYYECDFRLKTKKDGYKWIHNKGKAFFDKNNKPYRVIGAHIDISKLKEYQDELHYAAYHDALTGLYSRLYLYERIGLHLKNSKHTDKTEAMLFIDADNFKFINDTMGHSVGDKLIIDISTRLLNFSDPNCILFRLGGDEFIFYLKNATSKKEVEAYAQKIIEGFIDPFTLEGNAINVTLSIGISLFPEDGKDIDTLLKCADMAMYKAKDHGRNGFYFFNQFMNEEMIARVNTEKYFKKAMMNNEFIVYYQPQISVDKQHINSFEALIRWQSPELGMVPPLKFINIAEETGFIVPLGEWILKSACNYIKELNDKRNSNYKISVNISVIQLLQKNFTDMVCTILSESGLPPASLELEITESIIMDSPDLVISKLRALRDKGIGIALDDFGTGYSSLSYLRNIPITTLKIDKSFIDDIANGSNHAITDSIIDLGHKIGLTIIAEGVETNEQLNYLEKNSCDTIQGFLFSKPLPPSELELLLQKYEDKGSERK